MKCEVRSVCPKGSSGGAQSAALFCLDRTLWLCLRPSALHLELLRLERTHVRIFQQPPNGLGRIVSDGTNNFTYDVSRRFEKQTRHMQTVNSTLGANLQCEYQNGNLTGKGLNERFTLTIPVFLESHPCKGDDFGLHM